MINKHLYDFEFAFTDKRIKDKDVEFAELDIMCWDFKHNWCGTIYGDGIDSKNWIIKKSRVKFFNTSPNIKDSNKDLLNHFLKALQTFDSSELTSVKKFEVI